MSDPVASFRATLTPERLGPDPLAAFSRWLDEAEAESGMNYPNAATLSTISEAGDPDGRIVLVKGVDQRGFRFFTNYHSAKGRALEARPQAALTFYWDGMGRQVRVRGDAERLAAEESDAYFASRPRGSRLSAWASSQSRPLADRDELLARYREVEERYEGREVPRPDHWGGFLLRPREVEFWQEAPYRMHDRLLYRGADGEWTISRLSP